MVFFGGDVFVFFPCFFPVFSLCGEVVVGSVVGFQPLITASWYYYIISSGLLSRLETQQSWSAMSRFYVYLFLNYLAALIPSKMMHPWQQALARVGGFVCICFHGFSLSHVKVSSASCFHFVWLWRSVVGSVVGHQPLITASWYHLYHMIWIAIWIGEKWKLGKIEQPCQGFMYMMHPWQWALARVGGFVCICFHGFTLSRAKVCISSCFHFV